MYRKKIIAVIGKMYRISIHFFYRSNSKKIYRHFLYDLIIEKMYSKSLERL